MNINSFIKKAIAYFVIFFIIISLNNICNAITFSDLAKKYYTKEKTTLGNDGNSTFMLTLAYNYLLNSNNRTTNSENTNNHPPYSAYPNGEVNPNEIDPNGNLVNPELTDEVKMNAECNHNYFKLSAGFIRKLPGNPGLLCATIGEIKLENLTYTISENANTPNFDLRDGMLIIDWTGIKDDLLTITVYYYSTEKEKWFKDTCKVTNNAATLGGPNGDTPYNSDQTFYDLSGKDTRPGYQNRLWVDLGGTKQTYIVRQTSTPLMNIDDITPEISDVSMDYDSEYIDVKFENNHFYIYGKKIGTSNLKITFHGVYDKFQYLDGTPVFNRYYSVFAEVQVKKPNTPIYIEPGDQTFNESDPDKRIPESISFKSDELRVKRNNSIKLEILCDGEPDYTEAYSSTQFFLTDGNGNILTDGGSFITECKYGNLQNHGNAPWFNASNQCTPLNDPVYIRVEKNFDDGINITKKLTADCKLYVYEDFE